ncbi:MAG: pantoate--beta-alanine ligase [Oligoflexales bacterium]|nr:pantoate--beta-alanine ligase [Oligoflexales bacterium]
MVNFLNSKLIQNKSELKEFLGKLNHQQIALVPTMGALHAGHLSLVEKAKTLADQTVVSIYVNPSQFGENEDLDSYPRTLENDLAKLSDLGVSAVYAPGNEQVYPEGFQTYVYNNSLSNDLCGASRPGHFQGVCTIVLKLINLMQPKWVVFGKKDYQQYKIIEQMVRDLDLDTGIVGADLVRDSHGLALSSRNKNLNEDQKKLALSLYQTLQLGKQIVQQGERDPSRVVDILKKKLLEVDGITLDYLEMRQADDLSASSPDSVVDSILLGAIKVGSTRLIDNMPLS